MPRCPGCGETVSQFAAGCAICGSDLELPRRSRVRAPALPAPRLDQDAVLVLVIVLLTLGIPLVGLAAAIYQLSHNTQAPLIRRALWVVLAFGVAMLVIPQVRYGALRLVLRG
jgi:cell division protein FtsW (lipid II flippase)